MLRIDNPGIGKRCGTGADDETTRRDFEGDGEEDQLAGGSGDHRRMRPDHAPDARRLREVRLHGTDGSAAWKAEPSPGAHGKGGGSAAALPGDLFRSQHAALSPETAGTASD